MGYIRKCEPELGDNGVGGKRSLWDGAPPGRPSGCRRADRLCATPQDSYCLLDQSAGFEFRRVIKFRRHDTPAACYGSAALALNCTGSSTNCDRIIFRVDCCKQDLFLASCPPKTASVAASAPVCKNRPVPRIPAFARRGLLNKPYPDS